MRKLNFALFFTTAFALCGCSGSGEKERIAAFESEYVASLGEKSQSGHIKLVGYEWVSVPKGEREEFAAIMEMLRQIPGAMPNSYSPQDYSLMRLYSPLAGATVKYKGGEYVADSNGEISLGGDVKASGITLKTHLDDDGSLQEVSLRPASVLRDQNCVIFDLGERPFGEF